MKWRSRFIHNLKKVVLLAEAIRVILLAVVVILLISLFIYAANTITIIDVSVPANSTLANTTLENNFTHLRIGNITTGFINETNLILYMPFDTNTTSNTVYDYSNLNNDGNISGAKLMSGGYFGTAFNFSGASQKINISDDEAFNMTTANNLTLAAWIKPENNASGAKVLFDHTLDYRLQLSTKLAAGMILFFTTNTAGIANDCNTTYTLPRDVWTHVAATYNGTTKTIFINGIENATCLPTGTIRGRKTNFSISCVSEGNINCFPGFIDEVLVLNVSLNSTLISNIYKNQSSRFFSRGEQVFRNINVSGDGTENRLNITINSTTLYSSSINVSVGSVSGSDYTYGTEAAFINNQANNLSISSPNNISLKFIFYAGNYTSNSFISPTLENNITLLSFASRAPYATLNAPANASAFLIGNSSSTFIGFSNVTLNVTVIDPDGDTMDVEIYGILSNFSDSTNFTRHGLLYRTFGVANNTEIFYNWTSPVTILKNTTNLLLLYHLDNNSRFGENDTNVYDFSENNNNGTVYNATPITSGKFAGAFRFKGSNKINRSSPISSTDKPFTLSAWANYTGPSSNNPYIFYIQSTLACSDNYGLYIARSTGRATMEANNGIEPDCLGLSSSSISGTTNLTNTGWHHIVGVFYEGAGSNLSRLYVDGIEVANDSFTTSISSANFLEIGRNFNGTIDETALWTRNLSSDEIKSLYRLQKGKYFWKVNTTDSQQNNNESVTREFVIRDTSYALVYTNWTCNDLLNETKDYYYGSNCSSSVYSTCIVLNADLNITSGNRLDVPSTCNIIFNSTIDGQYRFIIHGSLNITGGNITSNSTNVKFNLTSTAVSINERTNNGNISFANFRGNINVTDSTINFTRIDIDENSTILLNSSEADYTITGGSLERRFRLNVSVYSSGAIVTSANVTGRNVTNNIVFSKLTGSDGSIYHNLTQYIDTGAGKTGYSNYTINATKSSYVTNSVRLNLTGDNSTSINLALIDVIDVTSTETPHDIFTRIDNNAVFNNLSDATRPCRYAAKAGITISGELILENCILEMNSSSEGQYLIKTTSGANLTINNSNLTWSTNERRYNFQVFNEKDTLIISNSYIFFTLIDLANDNITFKNNTVMQSSTINLRLGTYSNGSIIENSRFLGPSNVAETNIQITTNNITIINSNLSGVTSLDNDIVIDAGYNATTLNTNFTTTSIGVGAYLTNKHTIQVKTLSSASINISNISGHQEALGVANASGSFYTNLTEYIENETEVRQYWTPHNSTVNKTFVRDDYQIIMNISKADKSFSRFIDAFHVFTKANLWDLFTDIGSTTSFASSMMSNLSTASVPCRYAVTASPNITSTLILESCTLEMNSSADGQYYIEVGGTLTANYSNFTYSTNKRNYRFYTMNNSNLTIINSYVYFTGSAGVKNGRGLTVNNVNTTLSNITFVAASNANLDIQADNISVADSTFNGANGLTDDNILIGGNNILIKNSNLSGSQFQDITFLFAGKNATALNSTFTKTSIPAGAYLTRQWYLNVNINSTNETTTSGASILIVNITNGTVGDQISDSNGQFIFNITEYTENETETFTYQTPHNLTINKTNYITNSTATVNISNVSTVYNANSGGIYNLNVTLTYCLYSSGNFNLPCGCNSITTNQKVTAGNNVSITGSGNITVSANITGFDYLYQQISCYVQVKNGGYLRRK